MIKLPLQTDILELRNHKSSNSLSIYLPFSNIGPAAADVNRIELKNLLNQARTRLKKLGAKENEIRKILLPAEDLLSQGNLWREKHEALAMFLSEGFTRYFHLPSKGITQAVTVGPSFDVNQLEKVINSNHRFYILVLGRKKCRIYVTDSFGIEPVHIEDFPANMEESLRIDEYPRWVESHKVAHGRLGGAAEGYHGHYDRSEADKTMLLEFFRRIDKRLKTFFINNQLPLVLAGVDYLIPLYKQINSYPRLHPVAITGNLENVPLTKINNAAKAFITL